jgi:hypothetical protein
MAVTVFRTMTIGHTRAAGPLSIFRASQKG